MTKVDKKIEKLQREVERIKEVLRNFDLFDQNYFREALYYEEDEEELENIRKENQAEERRKARIEKKKIKELEKMAKKINSKEMSINDIGKILVKNKKEIKKIR
jgi:hypothetical protein